MAQQQQMSPTVPDPRMLEQVQPGNPVSMSSSSPDHPQPRSKDEVNRDLAAYEAALNAGKSEESKEDKKEPPKDEGSKKKSDDEWWDWQENDPLSNNKRRKSIEARLKSMAVEDLLMHGEVKQTVHIIPGKLAVVFRSASVDEDMEVKRMMFGVQGTDLYISNRYSMMQLTTSLYSIVTPSGEDVLPNHLDSDKNFNEDLFNKKFAHVKKWPTQFAQDLVNNYIWFDDRVKKLFVAEDLGNG